MTVDKRFIYGGIMVIVVIVLIYLSSTPTYEKYIYGLWVGDSDFCSDADVESMLLFIGQPINWWTCTERPAYIIISDDICSQGFSFTYTQAGLFSNDYTISPTCKFEHEDIFEGDRPQFTFDMLKGTLKIHSGDKLYGKFYKQNDISDILAV